jgi:ribosome maturation factor RimP
MKKPNINASKQTKDASPIIGTQTSGLLADLKIRITNYLEQSLAGTNHFVVGIHWSADSRKVSIKIDGDHGVGIDICSSINRALGKIIDEHLWQSPIVLEVGSPGADTGLIYPRQYPQHIGRRLKVIVQDNVEIIGELKDAGTATLVIQAPNGISKELTFQEIKEAKVLIF